MCARVHVCVCVRQLKGMCEQWKQQREYFVILLENRLNRLQHLWSKSFGKGGWISGERSDLLSQEDKSTATGS